MTTAEFILLCIYIFLIHICVHLDMFNLKIILFHSELSIVYMYGDTVFTSESCMGYSIQG